MNDNRLHAAIIMDGNGRWAQRQGLPRLAGHVEGERALRRIVRSAPECGISILTVYAFSADNWKRPEAEVNGLMALLSFHLKNSEELCRREGVRLSAIGRRDRLPRECVEAISSAEQSTASGTRLHLRIAVDYSSRDAIAAATSEGRRPLDRLSLGSSLDSPDVDLLIRTGGEQRLSDFLLWECAYAELFFTPCLWPDFGPADLQHITAQFHRRDRRFGGLTVAPALAPV